MGGYYQEGMDFDMWLIHIDAQGNALWDQRYADANEQELCYYIQKTLDGGFILGGSTTAGPGSGDMCLIKVDSNGTFQWMGNYGGTAVDICQAVIQTPDGGYLLAEDGGGDGLVVKTDSTGNQLWSQSFSVVSGDRFYAMCQVVDGSFGLAGIAKPPGYVYWQMWVVRMEGLQQAWVSLQPQNPPIVIPSGGGSFQYDLDITNCGTVPCRVDIWTSVIFPDSSIISPLLGPVEMILPTGASLQRTRTQNVPAGAPAGVYAYHSYAGHYPSIIWDEDNFTFEKLANNQNGGQESGWADWGESQEAGPDAAVPVESDLLACYPNPFNPTTTFSFNLLTSGFVKLEVFDINGRSVRAIHESPLQPGTHHILFDGSNLPSGIYIYQLQSGNYSASGKMMLLK